MDEGMIRIEHVSDYIGLIENNTSGFLGHHSFLYRGEGNVNYTLIPSIYRKYKNGSTIYNMYLEKETEKGIIQQFITEAASYIMNLSVEDRFTWVEYAQHYGTPTRLLDWTLNPLVALFFACDCKDDYSKKIPDAKVYCLNNTIYNQISIGKGKNQMQEKIVKEEAVKMIWDGMDAFPYPIVFRPYYFDKRMTAQSSCFMLWGSKNKPLNELIDELENEKKGSVPKKIQAGKGIELISYENTALMSYIIPGDKRLGLINELDRIGINKAVLFPGLDGIGASIERRSNKKYHDSFDI